MKQFLIIVKFLSVVDFCRFYEQFTNGRVFLPSLNPLPEDSKTILKLILPLIKNPVLVNGIVVSGGKDQPVDSGMTIDIKNALPTVLPDLNQELSSYDEYRKNLNLPVSIVDESEKAPQELTGLEFELELEAGENKNHFIEDTDSAEAPIRPPIDDSFTFADDRDDDLKNLKMENETDLTPFHEDLAKYPEFDLQDDDELNSALQDETIEIEPEGASDDWEINDALLIMEDDEPVSEGFIMDSETSKPDIISFETNRGSGVLFEDLKEMIGQDELEFEFEEEPEVIEKKIPEKKDLTTAERQKAEPVGQFFMNLTKAMLRSGYYAPGHPGVAAAKAGLYEEFTNVLGDQREIMITNHTTRDGIDLMLTGILDEPISIRVLVGPGVAELFAPKLSDYCERKKLLSFALKRDIQPDHFYQFIDIMSDPKVDDYKDQDAGTYLTNAFIEHGITDISTVFVDDMVKLETDLPWRVEMAIHRLAKDLKVMPMFKNVSGDAIKKMKLQTIQDIIRPLKHPSYLNDFLVNCYLIAKYVTSMKPEEIEEIVVDAFSIKLLLPTSQFTFKELEALKKLKKKHPDSEMIDRRLAGIKRILKLISRRVVVEEESGAQSFLEHLYRNNILNFHELPADVQYIINTLKMADDIRANFKKYEDGLSKIKDPDDALVYLKCFRRTLPILMDADDWKLISRISNTIKKVSSRKPINTDQVHTGLKIVKSDHVENFFETELFKSLEIFERPVVYIFKDVVDKIIRAYEYDDAKQRDIIDHILNDLGSFGVDIVSRMLTDSDNREVRKHSLEMLMKKGPQAKKWAVKILKDTSRHWYIHRNAMMILGKISDTKEDFSYIRNFLDHSNSKIREEVINVAVALKPHDGESIVLKAMNDEDQRVRWRAMRSLPEFTPISESTMNELLSIMSLSILKDKMADDMHIKQTIQIITAINAMPYIPISRKVETEVLEILNALTGEKKSLWNRIKKKVGGDHETPILKAAIPLLGKIGANQSKLFLKKKIRSYPDLAEIIKKALSRIES